MPSFTATVPTGTIQGHVSAGFEAVADTFLRNFAEHGEVGASLQVKVQGETVVDLWGGSADPDTGRAWEEDTVVTVFSCTKAATAFCAHLLAERGQLDLDAPVMELWPEYATGGTGGGKDRTTTRMMLDHTSALPACREPLKPDCVYDWDYMVEKLAAEEPFWQPGTRSSYHAITFGFLAGEMVRRAAGRSLGTYFAEEIAGPLGIDYWIGLPEEIEPRVAPIIFYRPPKDAPRTPFMQEAVKHGSIPNLFIFNHGDWRSGGANTRAGRAAEIGAAGGVTNGRGLAGLFAAMVSEEAAKPLGFSAATLASFGQCSAASHEDATLMVPVRFGPGFMLSMDNRRRVMGGDSVIMGPQAFGHVGAGGSLGFADPAHGLAFGYAMNKQGPGVFLNERGQGLVDATYRALGCAGNAGGFWV